MATGIGRSGYPGNGCVGRDLSRHPGCPGPSWSSGLRTPHPPRL